MINVFKCHMCIDYYTNFARVPITKIFEYFLRSYDS